MWFTKRIYADAAAASPLSRASERELIRLLHLYGNAGALHNDGLAAKKELEAARASIARSIGAHPDEIIFTASGTEANNLAIHGTLRHLLIEHGELHAITCAIEHQSVLEPLRALEREGLYTTELPVSAEGLVFPKEVYEAIHDDTVFVSIQLVNSEIGAIEPVRDIAKEIRRARAARGASGKPLYVHTDASQAPLWVELNVERLGVDLMTLDAQKVLGPKGIGALYIKRGTPIEPILWGGKQEQGLRGGTENVPQAGAFAVALAEAKQGVVARAERVAAVRNACFALMQQLMPDIVLHGPPLTSAERVANNLNISVPGLEAEMAVIALNALGISASTRSACTIGSQEPSHVIQALGVPKALAGTAVRLTFLPDITTAQAKRVARALKETADRYRAAIV